MQFRYSAKDLVEAWGGLGVYTRIQLAPTITEIYRDFQEHMESSELTTDSLRRREVLKKEEGVPDDVWFYVVDGKLVSISLETVDPKNLGGAMPVEIVFDRDDNGAMMLLEELKKYVKERKMEWPEVDKDR